jgi:hypothetical protein
VFGLYPNFGQCLFSSQAGYGLVTAAFGLSAYFFRGSYSENGGTNRSAIEKKSALMIDGLAY